MRGKPARAGSCGLCAGITPADAGKTGYNLRYALQHGDHPRGCGENTALFDMPICELGSPPRMRGKRCQKGQGICWLRITPADAGKTAIIIIVYPLIRDHPRGCGENVILALIQLAKKGSPPRMRGKHDTETSPKKSARITPADAGKTACIVSPPYSTEDHPRGCGENTLLKPAPN